MMRMGEVIAITHKITDHWEQYREQCEKGVTRAEEQLARIALLTSGQLELEFTHEETVQDMPA